MGHEETFWGDENVLYLFFLKWLLNLHNHQNLSTEHLRSVYFTVMLIIPQLKKKRELRGPGVSLSYLALFRRMKI